MNCLSVLVGFYVCWFVNEIDFNFVFEIGNYVIWFFNVWIILIDLNDCFVGVCDCIILLNGVWFD